MALLDLGDPPDLIPTRHTDYRPWLEHRCYDRACAYCLEHARVVEIDHVEPEALAPERAKDPKNLLPACATCNGPTGKWDYHPRRNPRKKRPHDDHGFLALDPRADDYARLFEVDGEGDLAVRPGPTAERVLWNRDVLFRLNRPKLRQWRKQAQDLARVAEHLVDAVAAQGAMPEAGAIARRDALVREVAQRLLFFELFEIALSEELLAQATAMRDLLRGPRPT